MSDGRVVLGVIVWLFWPWMIGVIDVMVFILTGAAESGIQWASWQGVAAGLWPFPWLFLLWLCQA